MHWISPPENGEAKPRLAYCCKTPAAQLPMAGLSKASAMLSLSMSRLKAYGVKRSASVTGFVFAEGTHQTDVFSAKSIDMSSYL